MKLSIPDLSIELMGDLARLEQSSGLDDPCVIDVHRLHVEHLAGLMGVGGRPDLEAQVDSLGDALVELRNGIARLAQLLDSIPSFPPGGETADITEAFRLLEFADRVCERNGFFADDDEIEKSEKQINQLRLI